MFFTKYRYMYTGPVSSYVFKVMEMDKQMQSPKLVLVLVHSLGKYVQWLYTEFQNFKFWNFGWIFLLHGGKPSNAFLYAVKKNLRTFLWIISIYS